jgi:hypothetical protein
MHELIHPKDLDKCRNILTNCINSPRKEFFDELRLRDANGEFKYIKSTKIRLQDEEGVNGVLCYLENIEEKKKYETSLNNLCSELNKRLTSEVEKNKKHEEAILHESRFLTMGVMMNYAVQNWQKTFYDITANHNSLLLCMAIDDQFNSEEKEYCDALKYTISQINHISNSVEQFRDLFTKTIQNHTFNLFPIINEMVL